LGFGACDFPKVIPMRFRLFDRLRLSPRTQRKLQRWGGSALAAVTYPFRVVFGLLKTIARLIAAWWEARNLRYLLQGLPSLIVAIGVIVLGAVAFFQDRSLLASQYEGEARLSLVRAGQAQSVSKDPKPYLAMAQTCYKRLSQLQPGRDENSFLMAQAFLMQRQPQAAESILKTLAPADKTRYGPAHLEMARWLLGQRPLKAEHLDLAMRHLIRAVHWKAEPTTSHAHAMLFDLYKMTNRPKEAEDHLVAAVNLTGDKRPDWRLALAQWYFVQGRREPAVRQAELAAETFQKRLEENVDDHASRFGRVNSLLMMAGFAAGRNDFKTAKQDYDEARKLCQEGSVMVAGNPQLARQYGLTLARVLFTEFDGLANDPTTPPDERFAVLEAAAQINPNDPDLLQRLVGYTRQSGETGRKAKKVFSDLIDQGKPSAIAHLILGVDAWQQNDFNTARYHWEKAFDLSNGAPLIANNLAWLLAHQPPVDLDKALGMIDEAIKKQDDPRYHGTRGHILFKMGRYKEAMEELERAKAAYPNDPSLFRALGECADKLGLKSEAERYKHRAEELSKAPTAPAGAGPAAPATKTPAAGPSAADPKADAPAPPKP
jgi:tetratricopeptide (TPR) repeat protein